MKYIILDETRGHLAQDILHHIGIMEEKERKEAQE